MSKWSNEEVVRWIGLHKKEPDEDHQQACDMAAQLVSDRAILQCDLAQLQSKLTQAEARIAELEAADRCSPLIGAFMGEIARPDDWKQARAVERLKRSETWLKVN